MGVGIDQIGTMQGSASVLTSFNYSGVTVGAGGVNRALLVWAFFGTSSSPTAITLTWDSGGTNQAMTAFGGTGATLGVRQRMYGLLNPTAGNKTLAAAWTTADACAFVAISLTGVVQTSNAVAFINSVATNYAVSTTPSTTITATNLNTGYVFECISCSNALTDVSGYPEAWNQLVWTGGVQAIGNYTVPTASPVVFNYTIGTATQGAQSGVEVVWDGTTGAAGQSAGIIGMGSAEW